MSIISLKKQTTNISLKHNIVKYESYMIYQHEIQSIHNTAVMTI